MTTSSAVPEELIGFADRQRREAERLLVQASVLAEAEARFVANCEPPPLTATRPMQGASDDARSDARRMVALAQDTGAFGAAFLRADGPWLVGSVRRLDDHDLARLALRVDPTAGLAEDLVQLSTEDRAAVLGHLGTPQLHALIAHHSTLVGNLDGAPWKIRVQANAAAVRAELERARRDHDDKLTALYEQLTHAQVLVFDPGHERLAVLHGDLDTARNVAVFVPGMGSTFSGFLGGASGTDNKGKAIYDAAPKKGREATAVVSWLGYPAPPGSPSTIAHVPFTADAREGARRLHAFVEGLGVGADQRVTLVGHSYGTLVVGLALRDGLAVDDVVLAGSPGVTVDHASAFDDVVRGKLYVLAAPGDPVAHLSWFGYDPDAPGFGATRLKANAPGRRRVEAHSKYFDEDSESLDNIAAVVAGKPVSVQRPSMVDRAADFATTAARTMQPELGVVHALAGRYEGPGQPVMDLADATAHEAEQGPAHLVEGAAVLAEGGGKAVGRVWRSVTK